MRKKGLMKKSLNEEELLFLSLYVISQSGIDKKSYSVFAYAEKLITAYIMEKHGSNISNKELEDRYIDLIADFIMTESANNNEIDVTFKDGKISYKEKKGKI